MPRFRCVFEPDYASRKLDPMGQDGIVKTGSFPQRGDAQPGLELVYEFEARNIYVLYSWLLQEGVPLHALRDIVAVEQIQTA